MNVCRDICCARLKAEGKALPLVSIAVKSEVGLAYVVCRKAVLELMQIGRITIVQL
jgi:hypothetical protein